MAAIDLRGQRFGRLTVVEHAGKDARRKASWRCRCACGTDIVVRGDCLRRKDPRKRTISCGCARIEWLASARPKSIASHLKHGACGKKRWSEYTIWTNMKQRCANPNDARFKHYGGRGIEVCERWIDSFEAFLADMGRWPSKLHTLDCIENDGDYEPGNCRWATIAVQNRNTRRQDYALDPLAGI